jgi:hypothetical protein
LDAVGLLEVALAIYQRYTRELIDERPADFRGHGSISFQGLFLQANQLNTPVLSVC